MKRWNLRHAFIVFHFTLGAVVLIQSVSTALQAAGVGAAPPANWQLVGFATLEALAAILFLVPRTTRPGGALLTVVLPVAFAVHALGGHVELGLLVYAAGALFVATHGNVLGSGMQGEAA